MHDNKTLVITLIILSIIAIFAALVSTSKCYPDIFDTIQAIIWFPLLLATGIAAGTYRGKILRIITIISIILLFILMLANFEAQNTPICIQDKCVSTIGFTCTGKPTVFKDKIDFTNTNNLGYNIASINKPILSFANFNCTNIQYCVKEASNASICKDFPLYNMTEESSITIRCIIDKRINQSSIYKGEFAFDIYDPIFEKMTTIKVDIDARVR